MSRFPAVFPVLLKMKGKYVFQRMLQIMLNSSRYNSLTALHILDLFGGDDCPFKLAMDPKSAWKIELKEKLATIYDVKIHVKT